MVDKRIEKTRAALKWAVLELASKMEFSAISIADIVRKAGIGYPTFFRHYRSKEALLADTSEVLVSEVIELVIPLLLAGDTAGASLRLCRYVDERRRFCRALLAGSAEATVRRQLLARAEKHSLALEIARPNGLPHGLALYHTASAMLGLISWWLEQGSELSAEVMGALVDRLIMRPVHGQIQ